MNQLCKGSMALNEHAGIKRDFQHITDFCDPFGLIFPSAIGQKDERNTIFLQVNQGISSSGKRLRATKKYAINAVSY